MAQKLKNLLIQRSLFIFLAIGVMNTLLNWALMLLLYNRLGLNYWGASAIGFLVTSALSFVLNRRFSFRSAGRLGGDLARFALVIGVCYFVAYLIARPLIQLILGLDALARLRPWSDQIALIFGNVIFTGLNYFGQRFFAFREVK